MKGCGFPYVVIAIQLPEMAATVNPDSTCVVTTPLFSRNAENPMVNLDVGVAVEGSIFSGGKDTGVTAVGCATGEGVGVESPPHDVRSRRRIRAKSEWSQGKPDRIGNREP
jgi:hypothetical protein